MDDLEDVIFGDKNERFFGKNIDPEKLAQLMKMRKACKRLAEIEPEAKVTETPFGNKVRNGSVRLDLPEVFFWTDSLSLKILSALFGSADAVTATTLAGGIRITFSIHDMWLDYDYEEEQK